MRALLLSLPALLLYAVVLLAVAIWFAGPLLPIGGEPRLFDPIAARLVAIGVLLALWGLVVLIRWLVRRRRNAKLAQELSAPDATGEAISAESAELRAKFAEALAQLRRLRFRSRMGGSRYLYELPWYVFIGPPASGKTTALLNCGLDFPLRRGDEIAVEGVAGTRNCDWIFTNQAVFIDTAGRYVSRDSDARIDGSAFSTFLDLLIRHRPGEALNGVIVAISVEDLARGDRAALDRHAEAVRTGIQEIMARMRTRVPVYVMFTKADLLKGFTELFQDFSKSDRDQVWGVTFPFTPAPSEDAARARAEASLDAVEPEMQRLLQRLGELQFPRMQDEADVGVRSDVFGFSSQFSSLVPVVSRFLRQAFGPDRYSEATLLRGFYFTSATQQGQPVDRLIASLSQEFGAARQSTRMAQPGRGRAYFLRGLLEEVIFPESGLAAQGAGRRRTAASIGRWAAILALVALPVALGLGWWQTAREMQAHASAFATELAGFETDLAALAPDIDPLVVEDHDFEAVLGPLDRLAAERARLASAEPSLPLNGLGAADLDSLREQATLAYFNAVDDLFRTRVLFRLEQKIDAELDDARSLYNTLKTYLMIGGQGPMDEDYVRARLEEDWRTLYDPNLQADVLERMRTHLEALLTGLDEGFLQPRELNPGKLSIARANAKDVRPSDQAYGILMSELASAGLRPWTIRDAEGGRAAEEVLVRISGEPLDAPIPGAFTWTGFWDEARPRFDVAVARALSEKWVLADGDGDALPSRAEVQEARRQLRELYQRSYIDAWRGFLEDLRIVGLAEPRQAATVLLTLSSRGSPLRGVLVEAARQTDLSRQPESPVDTSKAAAALGSRAQRMMQLAGDGDPGGQAPGALVTRAFEDLRDFVGDGAAGPLDALMLNIGELRAVVSDLAARRSTDLSALSSSPAADDVARSAEVGPDFVRRMISESLQTFNTAVADGLRGQLSETWRNSVVPFCRSSIQGRYPFGSGPEMSLGDLSDVLGPEGVVQRFFDQNLAAMVDTSRPQWVWKGLGQSLGLSQERLRFFQAAAELQDAFFPDGARTPQFGFGIHPEALEEGVGEMTLSVGDQPATFSQARRDIAQLSWPGPVDQAGAKVRMTVATGARDPVTGQPLPATPTEQEKLGVWGLFRLVDASGTGLLSGGAKMRVQIRGGGRYVSLIFLMKDDRNPFALRARMRSFQCPPDL